MPVGKGSIARAVRTAGDNLEVRTEESMVAPVKESPKRRTVKKEEGIKRPQSAIYCELPIHLL